MSSSLGTRIARVVAAKEKGGNEFCMLAIKKDLARFPGLRMEYRGTERVADEMAHIFFMYIPKGSESRYAELFAMIGDRFYQGNQYVIYKWSPRPTPAPTPAPAPTKKTMDRLGYNVTSTWGVPAFDSSIEVLRFEKRK